MNKTQENPEFIYHLLLKSDFFNCIRGNMYTPPCFAEDGFIHCTAGEDLTILVAKDYFSKVTELIAFKIRLDKIVARVLFEAPAPISGGGNSHLQNSALFPHIYGSLNLDAIEGISKLPKINYVFHFPRQFITLTQYIEGNPWI